MRGSKRPVLRVIGRSEFLLAPIREQARKDLDFDIEFELIDGVEGLQRVVTRPDTFDVYHQWHTVDLIWTARSIQPIELKRIRHGADVVAKAQSGRGEGRLFGTVFNKLFIHSDGTLGPAPSDRLSMLPSLHGVDCFGYLGGLAEELAPDSLDSWARLLDPRLQGRVAIMIDPVLGMTEAALATEAAEGIRFDDIGNLSIEEIDVVADLMLHKKKMRHFKGVWRNFEETARLMQKGGVALQSMFSPALTRLRGMGLPVVLSVPAEGCRGWHEDLCISAAVEGETLDAAYDYLNWWMEGWALAVVARQGYYATFSERARAHLSDDEWAYWYDGRPAESELNDPYGNPCIKPGGRREGGAHRERLSQVRVWNTFMDEHTYLVRRWTEFLEA